MTSHTQPANDGDLILAARQGLLPAGENAWLGGFGEIGTTLLPDLDAGYPFQQSRAHRRDWNWFPDFYDRF
jgi:hypothetical protein